MENEHVIYHMKPISKLNLYIFNYNNHNQVTKIIQINYYLRKKIITYTLNIKNTIP